jgi:hypothetical protein
MQESCTTLLQSTITRRNILGNQRPDLQVLQTLAPDIVLYGRKQFIQFMRICSKRLAMIRKRQRYEAVTGDYTSDVAKWYSGSDLSATIKPNVCDWLITVRSPQSC